MGLLEDYIKTITPKIKVDKKQKIISYNEKAIFGLNIPETYATFKKYIQGYKVKSIND